MLWQEWDVLASFASLLPAPLSLALAGWRAVEERQQEKRREEEMYESNGRHARMQNTSATDEDASEMEMIEREKEVR